MKSYCSFAPLAIYQTTFFVVENALLIRSTYTYMYTLFGGGSMVLRHKESVKFYKEKENL